ncbi:uncharacterized protein PgNI_02618 [Pyricularia grisea]|uniref:Malonyl-CoA:ACP transacylase (MAT) domain-containing protein n=1 Tax=Pyricularia grisea TaxID=148305 RepID=A0A6P8BLX8_PYRGI|nr:uncharacterized protein PgNI_02618 [Pyricularia grisea]TLD17602.1 hypothetical protein PgNI_02618 [Pyricularia grisea]
MVKIAAEFRYQFSAKAGNAATRTPETQPRIGFGAQWAGMGVEMLKSHPVFRDSVRRSVIYLKLFGCDWDSVKELLRPKGESRLKSPIINQPICTVFQIALVNELRSWGVIPKRVVNHSSGEIGTAYSVSIFTYEDAVEVIYLRGKCLAGLADLKGGIIAVGCSHKQASSILEKHHGDFGGMVIITCVNFPNSITLFGDYNAFEKLRGILEGENIFARMLLIDVAYYSSHMQRVIGEYGALMADIKPIPASAEDPDRTIIFFSVTASKVAPKFMGNYYWVRNLVFPVLFKGAVKEMVSGNEPGANAAPATSKSLNLLIEIGPYNALGGPIEQILSHYNFNGINYKSAFNRLQNAINTILDFGAALFAEGVNGDFHCQLLTNLPPYPWNHFKIFRCDSRIAKKLLAPSFNTRNLLGSPVPIMDEI